MTTPCFLLIYNPVTGGGANGMHWLRKVAVGQRGGRQGGQRGVVLKGHSTVST